MPSQLEQFLDAVNDAYARGDIDFFETNVTDDVYFEMVGDRSVRGREALLALMRSMADWPLPQIAVENVITHGSRAAVEGTMRLEDKEGVVKTYGFCDVYEMSDPTNPKIRSVKSYILAIEDEGRAEVQAV